MPYFPGPKPRSFSFFIFSTLFCLILITAPQPSSSANAPVKLLFTLINKKTRQFVATLRKEDIRVLEDGVPQEITGFEKETDRPHSVFIMLDTSISQEKVIPVAKEVSQEFVVTFIRPGLDSVGIITFTGEAKLEQALTSDLPRVLRAVERVVFKPPEGYVGGGQVINKPGKNSKDQNLQGSTAIWDSISYASEKMIAQTSDVPRRAVILMTDGFDTSSRRSLSDAAEIAIKSGVFVFSIGVGDEFYGGTDEGALKKLSERTGGRAYFPRTVKDLWVTFAEIEQELRSQYLVSFSSNSTKTDNKLRKIKIQIVSPELRKQDLQVSHQQGYFTKD